MGGTDKQIRRRGWIATIGLAVGVGFGISSSGLGVVAGLLSAAGICTLVTALFLLLRRGKSQTPNEDPHGLREGFLCTLTALTASGAWFGVSTGRLYIQYLFGSETKAGEWVILIAPIVFFGAQGAGFLKRPAKTEHEVSRNRAAAYLSLGMASVLAVILLGAAFGAR